MFKVRNLMKKEEINTEFWLEGSNEGMISLKAKRNDQEQSFTIANIYEDGMFICGVMRKEIADLGFKVITKSNGLSRIRVEFE